MYCRIFAITFVFLISTNLYADEDVWALYLTSTDHWPEKSSLAAEDIKPLPPQAKVDASLAALGRALFMSPKLSITGRVSCASCHLPGKAFSDPIRVSKGVNGLLGDRNSPSLLNADLWTSLFWDGRAQSLAEQALAPVIHPKEMGASPEHVIQQIKTQPSLAGKWHDAYASKDVEWEGIALALAEFQKGLRGPNTNFDKFYHALENKEFAQARELLTTQELQGMHLYRTKAGCVNCHSGELFSDQKFHNTGLHYFGRSFEDLGVYEITQKNEDMGKFRTPMLRHLMDSRPWMHNGLFDDLLGIVRMYKHGGARPKRPKNLAAQEYYPETSPILTKFSLSKEEEQALVAFLQTL